MKLIDKDAVVAEIVRRRKEIPQKETDKALKALYGNEAFVLTDLLSFLDTLKVKEYIDKVSLVAEIERFKKEEGWCPVGKDTADIYYARGFRFACERIISCLDTIEVNTKERHLCGECKHFGYNVMGECICNLENGNKKASPYVGACEDNFTTKD